MRISQNDQKRAVVKTVQLDQYQRVIVVSDIHGDRDGLIQMLERVKFSQDDAIIIVGDLIEKGAHSLELLKTVIQYAKTGNLYAVEGNNDAIFINWYQGKISDEDICQYVKLRKSSIFSDMAAELNQACETEEDVKRLKSAIAEAFPEEIEFLCELPHILESEQAIFVHAGIRPGELSDQDSEYCMTAEEFGRQPYHFDKLVVVGHWPVSNYSDRLITVNPYYNKKSNVISIDGGNSMKRWQQINYLLFTQGELQFGSYDNLPRIQALDCQKEEPDPPVTLCFPNTRIAEMHGVGERGERVSCYFPYLKRELSVSRDHIYRHKGRYYCYDFTTYCLPVEAGEVLTYCGVLDVQNELIGQTGDQRSGILVKRNGIVGNYYGRYQFLSCSQGQ